MPVLLDCLLGLVATSAPTRWGLLLQLTQTTPLVVGSSRGRYRWRTHGHRRIFCGGHQWWKSGGGSRGGLHLLGAFPGGIGLLVVWILLLRSACSTTPGDSTYGLRAIGHGGKVLPFLATFQGGSGRWSRGGLRMLVLGSGARSIGHGTKILSLRSVGHGTEIFSLWPPHSLLLLLIRRLWVRHKLLLLLLRLVLGRWRMLLRRLTLQLLLLALPLQFTITPLEPPLHELQRFSTPSRSARHCFDWRWVCL